MADKQAMRKEIRICGFGGQGIILVGVILGEAAMKAGFRAVQTQSYGPESRGGAARCEVILSSEPIDYPRVTKADVVVALSQVAYDKYDNFDGRFGHIFCEKPFSNYVIRVEYRFVGDQVPGGPGWAFRNSGIMIHGQSPESMKKDQNFPVSVEVQLLGGGGSGTRPTANVCTPGTHIVIDGKLTKQHCISSRSKTYHGDQWVTVEVEVRGNKSIKHVIDGKTVLQYTRPQLDEKYPDARKLIKDGDKMLRCGSISLQAESHPVEFRKVELRKLED